jgi:hypothetical protein
MAKKNDLYQYIIRKTCLGHSILSFITALQSGIGLRFSYSLLFDIWSVKRVPSIIHGQFLWKTLTNLPLPFEVTLLQNHTWPLSLPYCPIFQSWFTDLSTYSSKLSSIVKNILGLGYSTFYIYTVFSIIINGTIQLNEAIQLILLLVIHHRLFVFMYS